MRSLFVLSALMIVTTGALADPVTKPGHDCTCRAKDRRVHLGDTLCLDTAEGPRIAMCVMNQNLPFWSFSSEGCAVSSIPSPRPSL
jgi:hypothetical protein